MDIKSRPLNFFPFRVYTEQNIMPKFESIFISNVREKSPLYIAISLDTFPIEMYFCCAAKGGFVKCKLVG